MADRLVITRAMTSGEVAQKLVDYFGQLDAAWVMEGIRQILNKEEFYPDNLELAKVLGRWGR
jgi:hypothetical protein